MGNNDFWFNWFFHCHNFPNMIKFQQEDLFFDSLKEKVDKYFHENNLSRTANRAMKTKMMFLYLGTILSYISIYIQAKYFWLILFCAFIYGLFTFLLAFNIVHDAGHYALFKSKKANNLSLLTLDLFGISSFLWKTNHNLHHFSPNVLNNDTLIDDFKLGRIIPSGKWHYIFKFQSFYIPILSLFYSISLFLVSDFIKFPRLTQKGGLNKKNKRIELIKLIGSKLIAVFFTVLFPIWFFEFSILQSILFFSAIHFGPGLMVGFFVAPSHFNTHLTYPIAQNHNTIYTSWSEHQLQTTEDFGLNNPILNFVLGGFNHHVAHHLFPNICHIHYPKITPLIQQTAEEFNITYHSSSFIQLYISHIKHLHNLGWNKKQ